MLRIFLYLDVAQARVLLRADLLFKNFILLKDYDILIEETSKGLSIARR